MNHRPLHRNTGSAHTQRLSILSHAIKRHASNIVPDHIGHSEELPTRHELHLEERCSLMNADQRRIAVSMLLAMTAVCSLPSNAMAESQSKDEVTQTAPSDIDQKNENREDGEGGIVDVVDDNERFLLKPEPTLENPEYSAEQLAEKIRSFPDEINGCSVEEHSIPGSNKVIIFVRQRHKSPLMTAEFLDASEDNKERKKTTELVQDEIDALLPHVMEHFGTNVLHEEGISEHGKFLQFLTDLRNDIAVTEQSIQKEHSLSANLKAQEQLLGADDPLVNALRQNVTFLQKQNAQDVELINRNTSRLMEYIHSAQSVINGQILLKPAETSNPPPEEHSTNLVSPRVREWVFHGREAEFVKIAAATIGSTHIVKYGAGHEFLDDIQAHNADGGNKFSYIVITPKTLIGDTEDGFETFEKIEEEVRALGAQAGLSAHEIDNLINEPQSLEEQELRVMKLRMEIFKNETKQKNERLRRNHVIFGTLASLLALVILVTTLHRRRKVK